MTIKKAIAKTSKIKLLPVEPSPNASGLRGVYLHKKMPGWFQGKVHYEGKNRSVGYFDNASDAHQAYLRARNQIAAGEPFEWRRQVGRAGARHHHD